MSNKQRENILTIKLPDSDLVFTRYLYVKDEVRIALLVSILNKSDDAVFWAYELYHSGFSNELFTFIWQIYYDFFYTLNPSFEVYLLKKQKEQCSDRFVSSLIQDLLIRPFNTDVFFLKSICANFEIEINYYSKITNKSDLECNLNQWIDTNDYRSLSQWFLNENKMFNITEVYSICLDIFEKNGLKLNKPNLMKVFINASQLEIKSNVILLSKVMSLFSVKEDLKKGRNLYMNVEAEDIIPYDTITETKHYQTLEKAYMCGIDDLKYLGLFKLIRRKYNIKDKYWFHWLYHASFSPVWSNRIREYGGYVDYIKKQVVFTSDDLFDEFHELYGYEPDEQKKVTQEKSIMDIKKINNWKQFNLNFKNNGLFEIYEEELEEFDVDGLAY